MTVAQAKDTAVTAPSGARRGSSAARRRNVLLGQIVFVVVWLGSWELLSGPVIDPFFASSPSAIAGQIYRWVESGFIWVHLFTTLKEFIIGLALGIVGGTLVGFTLGRMPTAAAILNPFVTMVYSLPKLALAPIFILWFGIGLSSKVVLVALMTFFLVFYNTFTGARDVDPLYVNSLRIMGASRRTVYQRVVIPSASVWVMTGIRIAVPQALIGAIVGELISSNQGIGFVVANAASFFDTTGVLAGVALVAVVSVVLSQTVIKIEQRVTRWKEAQ
ncbi:ABC transporter permease [Mycobacterium sp. NPDC003449]